MKFFLETFQSELQNTYIILFLIVIFSIIIKLILTDFSIPLTSDNLTYLLSAISFKNGDFSELVDRSSGWSFFLFAFFQIFDSDDFFFYSNLTRILSIFVSSISIPFVYLLSRKFLKRSFSIISVCLFAFEPHLIYNATLGLSESLYSLSIILSLYFLLMKDSRFLILSMIFVGISWWARINGLLNIIPVLITSLFLLKSQHYIRNLFLGFLLMILVITPILVQRYDQFGDPLYYFYSDKIFNNDLERMLSVNTHSESLTIIEYVDTKGISSLIETYVYKGITNITSTLIKILFPCIIFLIPLGILFSISQVIKKNFKIIPLWIFILISLFTMIITFSIVNERRFLYHLYPVLIIISVFGLEKIFNTYFSELLFFKKYKNITLFTIAIIIILSSIIFTFNQYTLIDKELENEKFLFSQYLVNNLEGYILDDYDIELEYLQYANITNDPQIFSNYKLSNFNGQNNFSLKTIRLYADSFEELIEIGKSYELNYIVSNEKIGKFHPYVDKLFYEHDKYQYLEKVFDSSEMGYQKLKIKVFKINYP